MPLLRAAALLMVLGVTARAQSLPWKPGDVPPSLAGFRLTGDPAAARTVLGPNVTVDTMGTGPNAQYTYTSAERGVQLVMSRSELAVIFVTQRDAGMLDSIRVGDDREAVIRRWGPPMRSSGKNAVWMVDNWAILVELNDKLTVTKLGLGRQG
jgi:hypothetical protein